MNFEKFKDMYQSLKRYDEYAVHDLSRWIAVSLSKSYVKDTGAEAEDLECTRDDRFFRDASIGEALRFFKEM